MPFLGLPPFQPVKDGNEARERLRSPTDYVAPVAQEMVMAGAGAAGIAGLMASQRVDDLSGIANDGHLDDFLNRSPRGIWRQMSHDVGPRDAAGIASHARMATLNPFAGSGAMRYAPIIPAALVAGKIGYDMAFDDPSQPYEMSMGDAASMGAAAGAGISLTRDAGRKLNMAKAPLEEVSGAVPEMTDSLRKYFRGTPAVANMTGNDVVPEMARLMGGMEGLTDDDYHRGNLVRRYVDRYGGDMTRPAGDVMDDVARGVSKNPLAQIDPNLVGGPAAKELKALPSTRRILGRAGMAALGAGALGAGAYALVNHLKSDGAAPDTAATPDQIRGRA